MLLITPAVNVLLANPLRLIHTVILAQADIQPPPADVLTVIPPQARPAPAVPDPAPVTSVMLVPVEELVPILVQARGILLPNPAVKPVQQRPFAEKLVTIIVNPAVPIPARVKVINPLSPVGRHVQQLPFAEKLVTIIVKLLKMPVVKQPETATHNICLIMVII